MAPKSKSIASDDCEVFHCLAVKGFACGSEPQLIPTEPFDGNDFVVFSVSTTWLRKIITGKQAYEPELATAITNVVEKATGCMKAETERLHTAAVDRAAEFAASLQARVAELDVSDDEDEGEQDETPSKKPRIHFVKPQIVTIKLEGEDFQIQMMLKIIHTEYERVKHLGLQKKHEGGTQSWIQKQGITEQDIIIPRIVGKVFYAPSQSSWNVTFENAAGTADTSAKGLKVCLTTAAGTALEPLDQMRAIRDMFPAAVLAWNTLDRSSKSRLNAKDYM